jgi:hypothetical protein
MNAYELADLMDKAPEYDWQSDAATMLRQQADRIKELETKYQQEFEYAENLLKEKE